MAINLILNVTLLSLLVASMILAYRAAKRFSLHGLHQDRRGASYSLTMLITLPFYVAMVLGGIELTSLFYSNVRFQRATLMTGRSIAISYQQEFEKHDGDKAKVKKAIEQIGELAAAAVLFSTGSGLEEHAVPLTIEETSFATEYLNHLATTTSFKPNVDTQRRTNYTAGATFVEFELLDNRNSIGQGVGHPDKAIVKVVYEHPFFSQAVGRLLGRPSSVSNGLYVWKLEKKIEISLEIARSQDGTMGIK
ncbi:hypothetical protein N9Y42_02965 [Mariniblastus sp.]|nr:hypothetical protein [Mariniblastus sp.]